MRRIIAVILPLLLLLVTVAAFGQDRPLNVAGKWQLSWEARIGTERGTLQLEQDGLKLCGTFQAKLGSPKVSGTLDGYSISLILDFPGPQPFTLVFTGLVDTDKTGNKMAGKFSIQNVSDGYDWHGENARPTNYSWTAIQQSDSRQADGRQSDLPSGEKASSSAASKARQ